MRRPPTAVQRAYLQELLPQAAPPPDAPARPPERWVLAPRPAVPAFPAFPWWPRLRAWVATWSHRLALAALLSLPADPASAQVFAQDAAAPAGTPPGLEHVPAGCGSAPQCLPAPILPSPVVSSLGVPSLEASGPCPDEPHRGGGPSCAEGKPGRLPHRSSTAADQEGFSGEAASGPALPAVPARAQGDPGPAVVGAAAAALLAAGLAAALPRRRRSAARPGAVPGPVPQAAAGPAPESVPQPVAEPVPGPAPGAVPDGAPWTVGFATNGGRIRSRNEDAGCAFLAGGGQAAVVADGLGGMPLGAEASAIAVRAAARTVRRLWRPGAAPAVVLHAAFATASARLAAEGLRRGMRSPRDGLRTTLLVALAAPDAFHYGFIGDGGIVRLGAGRACEALMAPQKADGEALNQLAASLGPFAHGAPVLGSAPRGPGDMLVLATDGVADRVQPRFYADVLLRHARLAGGDLPAAAARVLAMLANHVEAGLFRFDDNMTLALLGDGLPPGLPAEPPARHAAPEAA